MRLELRPIPVCLALALLVALPGCSGEKKQPVKGMAAGEVLQGSVSDAMLPIDQVRSQAPLAPRTEGDGSKRGGGDAGDKADDGNAPSGDAPADQAAGAASTAPPAATPSAE